MRQLASDFVARRPFGPYTQDKNNTIHPTLDNDIESLVEAEVLSLKVGWELTTTLACLCFENKDLELTKQNAAEKWGLVKVLLRQSTGIASCILDCKKNECYHQNYGKLMARACSSHQTLSVSSDIHQHGATARFDPIWTLGSLHRSVFQYAA